MDFLFFVCQFLTSKRCFFFAHNLTRECFSNFWAILFTPLKSINNFYLSHHTPSNLLFNLSSPHSYPLSHFYWKEILALFNLMCTLAFLPKPLIKKFTHVFSIFSSHSINAEQQKTFLDSIKFLDFNNFTHFFIINFIFLFLFLKL